MPLFSSGIKVIFIIVLTFLLYSETLFIKSAIYRYPTICSLYNQLLNICTKEYIPVCGTDGRTYCNKCLFCMAYSEFYKQFEFLQLGSYAPRRSGQSSCKTPDGILDIQCSFQF